MMQLGFTFNFYFDGQLAHYIPAICQLMQTLDATILNVLIAMLWAALT